MHESDPAIVARARDGDIDAFRVLVEQHSRYLFGVVFRLTRNAEDTQDVVQETWLKVHAQLGRFEARSDVRTWLTRIAVNCAIDSPQVVQAARGGVRPGGPRGSRVRRSERSRRSRAADRLVLAGEIGARVGETMSCLTAIERAAFMLRHVEGMSISEIGSELGLKTSATKHCIFRAVRKMRAALAPFVEA